MKKIDQEMEKIWRKKEEHENKDESGTSKVCVPPFGVDNSLEN